MGIREMPHGRRRVSIAVAAAFALGMHGQPALAADWANGGAGDWNSAGNWSPAAVPTAADPVVINNGGTAQVQTAPAVAQSVNLSSGALSITGGQTLTTSTTSTVGGGTSVTVSGAGSRWNAGGATPLDLSGTATLAGGGVLATTGGPLRMTGGTLIIGGGAAAGVFNGASIQGLSASTINFNQTDTTYGFTRNGTSSGASISISGDVSVQHNSSGTTILTGNNTYTGGTTINAGTLQIGNATSGTLTGNVTNNAALVLHQETTTARTFSGAVSGSGSLRISGGGTWILSGASTYAGGTTISSGRLQVGDGTSGSITGNVNVTGGSSALEIRDGGSVAGNVSLVTFSQLDFRRSDTFTFGNVISGGGGVDKNGSGTVVLTASNTYTGGTRVFGGALQIGNGGTTGSIAGDILLIGASSAQVTFSHSNAQTFSGNISGVGTLVKSGTGTLTLLGNGNFTPTSGPGVFVGGTTVNAGTLQIGNGGTVGSLGGPIVVGNGASIAFNRSDNIIYDGPVSGAGSLIKSGAGTLTLTTANTYTGGTTISAGTLQIGGNLTNGSIVGNVANNGTLVFARETPVVFPGEISGSGTVAKRGVGTLTLTGASTYTGATTVETGTLVVNGSIVSPVTVGAGATLGGSGSVGNVTVASGGAFAPGNSIGTLAVNGSVNFAAGSIYRVEIDPAGNSDRIAATGTATLSGGRVSVLAGSGTYQTDTRYTVLTANGGVTGTFGAVDSNFVFLTPMLSYDANNVFLTLSGGLAESDAQAELNAIAQTPNQRAMLDYLVAVANEPALDGLITQIENLTLEEARTAFASMSGETLSAPGVAAMQGTGRFLGLLSGRLGTAGAGTGLAFSGIKVAQAPVAASDAPADPLKPRTTRGLWTQAEAARGEADGTANAIGFDWRGGGVTFGFDAEVGRDTVIGVAVGYGQTDVDFDAAAGEAKVKSPRVALYGGRTIGAWELKGALGYANQDFDTRRNVTIGASTTVATATHSGAEYSAYGEAQYTIRMGGYSLKPLAGLRYIKLEEDAYTETGSSADLAVDARTTESIVSLLGARFVRSFDLGRGELEARVVWGHEHGDTDTGVRARLAAAPATPSFSAAGVPVERDFLVLGAGMASELWKNWFVHVDASVELRDGQNQQALTAALRYAW